ncbi:uncharacterized protein LOC143364246 [Halictus rubicundus]|uniref:uncharacterized protein LOC143364246 n=2 Tax=Halictus rubicundus TaxID=77578 RepID=UPI0040366676
MDSLIAHQHILFGRIARTVDNLRKQGKANINKGTILAKLSCLDQAWAQFQDRDAQIIASTTEENRQVDYFTEDFFDQTQDVYCNQKGILSTMLEDVEQSQAPSTAGHPPTPGPRPRSSLPRITLPTFSGQFTDWTRFRDLFMSLVIDDEAWTDAERFHYLSASLTGEAAQLIQRIPVTAANFDQAWKLLEHRYQNRRLLVAAQFDALYNIKPCVNHSATELKGLLNSTCNATAVLNSLGVPVTDESHWIVHHTIRRLDRHTLKEWEKSLGNSVNLPAFSELLEFLETTTRTLEAFEFRQGTRTPAPSKPPPTKVKALHTATDAASRPRCNLCQGDHILCFCSAFRSLTPAARLQMVTSRRWCKNCLGPHTVGNCPSAKRCQRCAQPHHTMLHEASDGSSNASTVATLHTTKRLNSTSDSGPVLLATALVTATAGRRMVTARALIDPCSEVSLISEALAQTMRLPRTSCSRLVLGAGGKATATSRGKVRLTLTSTVPGLGRSCTVEALVLPRLTAYKPSGATHTPRWPHINGLPLADPRATSATPIELLLGADVYPQILLEGIRRGGQHAPVAQETIFGWILSGPTARGGSPSRIVSTHTTTTDDLAALVRRFWEQEEVPTTTRHWNAEEEACDEGFRQTHYRQSDGRYVVRLCFKDAVHGLGETHSVARRILLSTERRLQTSTTLRDHYHNFMREYLQLGHMQEVARELECPQAPHFYLPHHGVMKGTGASAKLRVVFNGSRPSSTGRSLNDLLSAGPKLQRNLMDILLRWRRHKFAFLTDVEKMYRQIQVHPDDRDYQRVLWRDNPDQRIQVFHLTTVTYGLTCAPFLAIRTLLQLADDEEEQFPRGAAILREATYVDDILSGADSEDEARQTQEELVGICRAGGFTLKKWSANSTALTSHLPDEDLALSSTLPWQPELGCSALGLKWHTQSDTLTFSFQGPPTSPLPTLSKRYVLSQVAKLFDPLGWLAPATIRGKIFLQQLWQHRLDWDEQLPSTAAETWRKLSADAANLTSLRLPRWLGTEPATTTQQLHVFVDASERAYAAAAYIRTSNPHRTQVTLVAAKTKTAPLQSLSLPRLELCAAVLGARLLSHLRREMGLQFDTSHLWSDSTVTLAWLHGEPTRWRTFVANRVAEFHRTVPDVRLHHVGSQDNPADCASRGIPASQLASHPLWWHGPAWLTEHPTTWDTTSPTLDTTEEERAPTTTSFHTRIADTEHESLLHRYSSLTRLLRVTAWCLRWTRRRPAPSPGDVFPILHPEEVSQAEALWIKIVQGSTFERELSALNNGQPLRPSSALRATTPFLDNQGILRVGGRLKNSLLSYDEQHPIILPSGSKLTEMIVEQHHRRTLHGGVQLTLASVRQRFWIPQGRQNVKKCVSRCIRCLRWRAATASQLMGDLPLHRVTPSRPFTHTGVDYAGPFKLKTAPGRGHKSIKGYVAIFVCYSSRAVHLEAVSDYTTAAFLAAFRRFTGRRGPCASVTSDCGTNFVGADQELRRMFRASSKEAAAIAGQLSKEGVRWKFIPPGAPHFGGLWEAAVCSVKHHLRRVVGDNAHTYEELATFLCQVEACLNSRPLQALTDDPEDLTPLTPGHFLVGGPLLATPEPTLHDVPTSRLSRWQQLQQRVEHFWRRWSAEYLHQIQTRRKWTTTQPSLGVGDLVLVKSEATPPTKWPLARITDVHPGADGHVRVITVRTATTSFTRPVTKIVRLLQTGENQA